MRCRANSTCVRWEIYERNYHTLIGRICSGPWRLPGFSRSQDSSARMKSFITQCRNISVFWIIGAVAAVMTSFYMFRSVFMTFYGKSRVEHDVAHHLHESPPLMTVPLMILAFLSLVGGFVGIPVIEGAQRFGNFLDPVFAPAKAIIEHGAHHAGHHSVTAELVLMAVSLGIADIRPVCSLDYMYITSPETPGRIVDRFSGSIGLCTTNIGLTSFMISCLSIPSWIFHSFSGRNLTKR